MSVAKVKRQISGTREQTLYDLRSLRTGNTHTRPKWSSLYLKEKENTRTFAMHLALLASKSTPQSTWAVLYILKMEANTEYVVPIIPLE